MDILFKTIDSINKNKIGIVILNREKSLNALSHKMLKNITEQLQKWELDSNISAIIIKSNSEKAFSAGGDLKEVYTLAPKPDKKHELIEYFKTEYKLNHYIKNYPKPYIALLNGITMGGGAGISMHASHIIASENLKFAMPETSIGLYPDVGSCYFLSRLKHNLGIYLGLTGNIINLSDAKYCELINYYIPYKHFPDFIEQIKSNDISTVINQLNFISDIDITTSNLYKNINIIKKCFNGKSIIEIFSNLENQKSNLFAKQTLEILKKKSPISLFITLEQLTRAKNLSFKDCIQMDYNITYHCLEESDFLEGIRAVIIDKDNNPNWSISDIKNIDFEKITLYFDKKYELFDN